MPNNDLLIILAAAAAVFMFAKKSTAAPSQTNTGSKSSPVTNGVTLIKEWGGWRYYSDGTAIDPFGSYYYQGVKVYDSVWGDVGA